MCVDSDSFRVLDDKLMSLLSIYFAYLRFRHRTIFYIGTLLILMACVCVCVCVCVRACALVQVYVRVRAGVCMCIWVLFC